MAIKNTGLSVAGLRSEFMQRLRGVKTYFQDLTTRIASDKDSETYKWLGTVPNMREFGTGRLAKGLRTEGYSVDNQKYEATIEVDRDEKSDDQTGQIVIRIGELAQRAGTHKDRLLAALFENGASSGFNSYDGVSFFNSAHVSGASGNQNNTISQAAADGTSPTSAEFKSAIQAAIARMMTFKDDQGEPFGINQAGLTLVVPPVLMFPAMEALNATMLNNTSNVLAGAAQVLPLPYLTSTTKAFLCKTDGIIRPFIFQDREPIEFGALEENSEEGFMREKFLYGVRARYRLTYGYWQYAVQITFT